MRINYGTVPVYNEMLYIRWCSFLSPFAPYHTLSIYIYICIYIYSAHSSHTYGYAYGTDSGATRQPRVPIPKGTRTNHWILEVFKRNGGQSLKATTKRQSDDGRTCLPSEVLGLASCHSPETRKFAGTSLDVSSDISTATEASSLDCHFCGVDSPLLKAVQNNPTGPL